jgi:hypothetical protein
MVGGGAEFDRGCWALRLRLHQSHQLLPNVHFKIFIWRREHTEAALTRETRTKMDVDPTPRNPTGTPEAVTIVCQAFVFVQGGEFRSSFFQGDKSRRWQTWFFFILTSPLLIFIKKNIS